MGKSSNGCVNPDYIITHLTSNPPVSADLQMSKTKIPFYPRGGKWFTLRLYFGTYCCVGEGVVGQRYLVGYHNLSYKNDVKNIRGDRKTIGMIALPKIAVRLLGHVGTYLTVWMNIVCWIDPMSFVLMQQPRYRDGSKMVQELGIQPTPIE